MPPARPYDEQRGTMKQRVATARSSSSQNHRKFSTTKWKMWQPSRWCPPMCSWGNNVFKCNPRLQPNQNSLLLLLEHLLSHQPTQLWFDFDASASVKMVRQLDEAFPSLDSPLRLIVVTVQLEDNRRRWFTRRLDIELKTYNRLADIDAEEKTSAAMMRLLRRVQQGSKIWETRLLHNHVRF